VITAVVLINAAVDSIPEIAQRVSEIEGITEVYSVAGDVDLVAMVRVRAHEDLADVIAGNVNKVPGILSTQTLIAFRTYSKHDLEAAFSLGFDD
jgi:DNA-binding Lrp family transcriptional regulator